MTTVAGAERLAPFDEGLEVCLDRRLRFEFAARVEQHSADWWVEDRLASRTGDVDDDTLYGAWIGLAWSFPDRARL